MTTLENLQAILSQPAVEYRKGYFLKPQTPLVVCADGSTMSVQASEFHYCTPRQNVGPYTHVEVWRCSAVAWEEYGTGEDPYAFLPIEMVAAEIDRRGGFKRLPVEALQSFKEELK